MNLFDGLTTTETLAAGAFVLRQFATADESAILAALERITAQARFRHMITPGGFRMSVAMTNAGEVGWVTDRRGYRYAPTDPETGLAWPPMPDSFLRLAVSAAEQAGYANFHPDACLVNRYHPGAKMSLHQDKDEKDFAQPIVSVSLGIPATFLFGGLNRSEKPVRIRLTHGDVVVWGGPTRLNYHGIAPLKEDHHPLLGAMRVNLTFRKTTAAL